MLLEIGVLLSVFVSNISVKNLRFYGFQH